MGKVKGKAPAFQFYASDFLTDTQTWSEVEVAVHVRLLAWSWVNGGVPTLFEPMCRISPSAKKVWATVGTKWTEVEGVYFNARLEQARKDSDAFRERQREKALLAVAARNSAATADPSLTQDLGSPVGDPLEGEVEDTLPSGKERAKAHPLQGEVKDEAPMSVPLATPQSHEATLWPSFSDFWEAYGKSKGKPLVMQMWAKIPQRDREAIMAALPAYTAANEKRFRLDPERYLKRRAWEDEVIPRNTATNGKPTSQQLSNELDRVIAQRYGLA